jgi:hypothetical protein
MGPFSRRASSPLHRPNAHPPVPSWRMRRVWRFAGKRRGSSRSEAGEKGGRVDATASSARRSPPTTTDNAAAFFEVEVGGQKLLMLLRRPFWFLSAPRLPPPNARFRRRSPRMGERWGRGGEKRGRERGEGVGISELAGSATAKNGFFLSKSWMRRGNLRPPAPLLLPPHSPRLLSLSPRSHETTKRTKQEREKAKPKGSVLEQT